MGFIDQVCNVSNDRILFASNEIDGHRQVRYRKRLQTVPIGVKVTVPRNTAEKPRGLERLGIIVQIGFGAPWGKFQVWGLGKGVQDAGSYFRELGGEAQRVIVVTRCGPVDSAEGEFGVLVKVRFGLAELLNESE